MASRIMSLIIAHLTSALLYLSFPGSLRKSKEIFYSAITYKDLFSVWFFGIDGILIAIILWISTYELLELEKQFVRVFSLCLIIRGMIYALHYSHNISGAARDIMLFILIILVATLIIYLNARKHGFFDQTNGGATKRYN